MLQDVASHILKDTRVSAVEEDATHHEAGCGGLGVRVLGNAEYFVCIAWQLRAIRNAGRTGP